MGDINLLPHEMRSKEEKEKRASISKPKIFKVELSNPGQETKPKLINQKDIQEPFWQRVLGKPKMPSIVDGLIRGSGESIKPNQNIDLLSASRVQKTVFKEESALKNKGGRFSFPSFFGLKQKNHENNNINKDKASSVVINKTNKLNDYKTLKFNDRVPEIKKKDASPIKMSVKIDSLLVKKSWSDRFMAWFNSWFRPKPLINGVLTINQVKKPNDYKNLKFTDIKTEPVKQNAPQLKAPALPIMASSSKVKKSWSDRFMAWFNSWFRPSSSVRKEVKSLPVEKHADYKISKFEKPAEVVKSKDISHHVDVSNLFHDNKDNVNSVWKRSKLNINLIAENFGYKNDFDLRGMVGILVLAVIIPVLILGVCSYFIGIAQKKVNKEIVATEKIINDLKLTIVSNQQDKKEAVFLVQKILALEGVFNTHIYWSNFFTLLEKYTLDTVYYGSFSAGVGSRFILPATATTYEEAAKQITALEEATDFISEVKVNNISLRTEQNKGVVGVNFNLEIKPVDGIFYQNKK